MKSFSKMFNDFLNYNNIHNGKILKGKVINIDKDFVLIDSGLKSESFIPINEFLNKDNILEISLGDNIDLYLDSIENGFGKTILSRKKAKLFNNWKILENSYKNDYIIDGKVIEKVKGGFIVLLLDDIKSFLPGSLIDFKYVNSNLENEILKFKIIKYDKKNNNIILSRKAVICINNYINKNDFLNNVKEGMLISGIVKNITDYGAFIDLGFMDGLLHITDMTWKRIKHPSEIVKLGEEIKIKILKYDIENCKISLGLKQLTEDPWIDLYNKYPKYSKLSGKVTNLTDYGFFVEISNGIEGLVHISEISWKNNINNNIINPNDYVKLNDIVNVIILDIDINNRRISLGFKQCNENELENFCKFNKEGDNTIGVIKSITDFGIFVKLLNNIDGLIHITDILDDDIEKVNLLLNESKIGNIILSNILQIDKIKYRISLGINLKEYSSSYIEYKNKKKINDIVEGKIIFIYKNVYVNLEKNIIGILKIDKNNFNLLNDININKNYFFKIISYKDKYIFLEFLY